jgi:hypothetical protein
VRLPKYWRPVTRQYCTRLNDIAYDYIKAQAAKNDVTEQFFLNTLLTKMAVDRKSFDAKQHFPTVEERLAVAAAELTKEQHERAKVTRYGAVRRPRAKRRAARKTNF